MDSIMNTRNRRLRKEKELSPHEWEWQDDWGGMESFEVRATSSVVFKVHARYPFHPPRLEINGKEQIKWLLQIRRKFMRLESYGISLKCPCCSTITCTWSPCNTMDNLLTEYNGYSAYFRELYKFTLIENLFDPLVTDIILKYLQPI